MAYDLSILIPARNEMFLARTVQDILDHKEGKTEILVGIDGGEDGPPIPEHPDVRVIREPVSLGQRGMTNKLCKMSEAKYVMKTDAHCAFDQGFDVKLLADMQDDWTMVPIMRNLHAFDWVCSEGHRRYQGPSGPCQTCGKETTRDIVWIPKTNPQSKSYRFDKTLHFQYFNEFSKRPEGQGELTETMSLQGSFFLLTRAKYWELNICDEGFGSWGQQGVEVACKTWLSGGRVVVSHKTWYAHMFRTQGGDFSFPYHNPGNAIEHARNYSRELFLENKWPLAKHSMQWLIDKFAPVPDWTVATKGVVYISACTVDEKLLNICKDRLKRSFAGPIVSVTLKPCDLGTNIVMDLKPNKRNIFKQILAGLEALDTDYVFLCDDDVLYHPSHFDFTPPRDDRFYYNLNWWRVRTTDGFSVHWDGNQSNFLCANRKLLIEEYRQRVEVTEREGWSNRGYEPGTRGLKRGGFNDRRSGQWRSEFPNIDIRHGKNLTGDKWKKEDFRDPRYSVGWNERFNKSWGEKALNDIEGWEDLGVYLKDTS